VLASSCRRFFLLARHIGDCPLHSCMTSRVTTRSWKSTGARPGKCGKVRDSTETWACKASFNALSACGWLGRPGN
jgi:hypothetical protein